MFSIFREIINWNPFSLNNLYKTKYSKNEFPLLFIHPLYNCRALLIFIQRIYNTFLSNNIYKIYMEYGSVTLFRHYTTAPPFTC